MPLPLFYRQVVPLNRDTHRDLRLATPAQPLAYARTAHLVPAVVDEFATAQGEIPIAFLPGASQPTAVFVTSLVPGTNSFISEGGRWTGNYVPAYLRRYPFIVGDVPNAEPVLCIDEAYEGFGPTAGERLFSASGEPGAPVAEALALANSYSEAATRTDTFIAMVEKLDLLRTVNLDARLPGGGETVMSGLLVIDEKAFGALSDADFLTLRQTGFLPALYAHLFSLTTINRLAARTDPPLDRGPEKAP